MMPTTQPEKETAATPATPAPTDASPPMRHQPSQQRETAESPAPAPSAPLKSVTYQSVLERMKEYAGARTMQALSDLFKPAAGQIVRQMPAVAISDGESVVSLRVDLPLNLKETPSFSLRKASMVSFQQADDGSWLIEAKLLKNTAEARLTINCDGISILFPLVAAPPMNPALVVPIGSAEESFARYLKLKQPVSDLNGDGKNDYVDDYIFIANALAGRYDTKQKITGDKLP